MNISWKVNSSSLCCKRALSVSLVKNATGSPDSSQCEEITQQDKMNWWVVANSWLDGVGLVGCCSRMMTCAYVKYFNYSCNCFVWKWFPPNLLQHMAWATKDAMQDAWVHNIRYTALWWQKWQQSVAKGMVHYDFFRCIPFLSQLHNNEA